MSATTCESTTAAIPCHVEDPDLWFADDPADLEQAKSLCGSCPLRRECLSAALERQEPWGVWGGEILERGAVVARKRGRGRPRKNTEGAEDTEGTVAA
ncbi:MAG: WhiB family transcriptional regulator [Mycolicibacterium sp.]|uniref:WhiB family transcriptional regulator n=1 Tax=Mycolicibacterium sp. TaxID=2320850 RepID=UPI003D0B27FA